MRESTKILKAEMEKDIKKIQEKNNSKIKKRTNEQNRQVIEDKVKYYTDKWNELSKEAETETQKEYCKRVLEAIPKIKTEHYGYII